MYRPPPPGYTRPTHRTPDELLDAVRHQTCTICGSHYGPETHWACPCFAGEPSDDEIRAEAQDEPDLYGPPDDEDGED